MIWAIIAGILVLLGVVGTIVPFFPGAPLALIGLLLYGYSTDFTNFSGWAAATFIALTFLTFVIDMLGPVLGARGTRASHYGTTGAFLGVIIGVAAFGPLGIVIGPLLGAFLGELYGSLSVERAAHAAWGTFAGFVIGTAINLGIVFSMAGYFVYLLLK